MNISTVAVMLWAMEADDGIKPSLELVVDGKIDGGVGSVSTNNPEWAPRLKEVLIENQKPGGSKPF